MKTIRNSTTTDWPILRKPYKSPVLPTASCILPYFLNYQNHAVKLTTPSKLLLVS